MPNRIIRETILGSDRIELLDPPAEVFYRRLMSKVDDYGRYDARPPILRAALFPLRLGRVREADCSRWIAECEKAGLITLYYHDGKPYLEMANTGWTARSPSKYPEPNASANICAQVQTNARLDVVVDVVQDVDVCEPRKRDIPLAQWIKNLNGEPALATDDPLFAWAQQQGIPGDWLSVAWVAFENKYIETPKKYTDWRAHFRKEVKSDWLKVWRQGRNGWELTTAGIQAEREMTNG